ncbi:MAG: GNAT family N-acetyltransferase [Acidobacteria bacterium]|nr:GNAT family N-acetyltransferase [Acidobacteriota bacterium]
MLLEYATTTIAPSALIAEISSTINEDLAEEWRALCAEGPCDQPFFRPEWITAYGRAFAPEKKLLVLTVRSAGHLRAVLPLLEERASLHGVPVRKLRSAANAHSCRFDVIHGAVDREDAVQSCWNLLKRTSGWDVIELEDVPAGGAGESLLRLAAADGFHCGQWSRPPGSYLALPEAANCDDVLPTLVSSKLRKSLRYYQRKLESQGTLQFRRIAENDLTSLEQFYQLEHAGWKGRAGTAIACDAATRQFYDDVAHVATQHGYFSLYSLELNQRPIAMQYCLNDGGRLYLLKPAFDEAFSAYSPGHLITYEVLRDLISRGFREYDFLSPHSEWKGRWAQTLRAQSTCYVFRRGLVGTLLHTWKFQVAQTARQLKGKWKQDDR